MRDLFSVAGKVALVTGGSRGIGRMIAHGLVANGARTYVTARKAEACAKTATELSRGGECVALPADLAQAEERTRLVAELSARENALHILVNNAGANWSAPLSEFPESGWDKVMDVNLKAVFFLTRDLLPLLRKAGDAADPARVVNVGSIDRLHVPAREAPSPPASQAG